MGGTTEWKVAEDLVICIGIGIVIGIGISILSEGLEGEGGFHDNVAPANER